MRMDLAMLDLYLRETFRHDRTATLSSTKLQEETQVLTAVSSQL